MSETIPQAEERNAIRSKRLLHDLTGKLRGQNDEKLNFFMDEYIP